LLSNIFENPSKTVWHFVSHVPYHGGHNLPTGAVPTVPLAHRWLIQAVPVHVQQSSQTPTTTPDQGLFSKLFAKLMHDHRWVNGAVR